MSVSPLLSLRFKIFYAIISIAILTIHEGLMYWYGFKFKIAFTDAAVSTLFLMLAILLLINTLRFYLPKKDRFIHLAAWCIILTISIVFLNKWVITYFLRDEVEYIRFFEQSLIVRLSLYFLIIAVAILMSVIWYTRIEDEENMQRKQDLEKLAREAELFKLRQQLQPHFLFNSLNSINALIGSSPEEARKMVMQLSDFLRGTLRKEEQQWVTLKEELQYLQLYLDIEKVRFGHRLSTLIEVDEKTETLKLPALLLQPLVENAIKFGLYDTTGDTVIRLSAVLEEQNLTIKISNPFDPETSSPKTGTGFGLQSVQRRLYLLFARNDLLATDIKEKTFFTTVKIPQPSEGLRLTAV
jgi:two-component system, LytTR family, sensor kinase